ncbi:MAG: hypothetical protein ABIO57_01940 [Candidatus Paceibacterota bacterium]
MTSPEGSHSAQENALPYSVEKIEDLQRPEVGVKSNQLLINGEVLGGYKHVSDVSPQKNNSDLVYFNAVKEGEESSYNTGRIIDINNPEKELVTITASDNRNYRDSKKFFVNGNEWNSLQGKNIYFSGYHVEHDPIGNKTVFRAHKDHAINGSKAAVIVNNREWNTGFSEIQKATSEYGTAYALADGRLVIEDKEWLYPKYSEQQKKDNYSLNWNGLDTISEARIGKNGEVAAALYTTRGEGRDGIGSYIITGDTQGARNEWKHPLQFVKDIAIDEVTGMVAAYGSKFGARNKTEIIINDIPYTVEDAPEKLNYFTFKDGALVIEYTDALGQKVAEKITLNEQSGELQIMKEGKDSEEKALYELRKMLAEQNIPISEIMSRLNTATLLEEQQKNNKNLANNFDTVHSQKATLEIELQKQQALIAEKDARIISLEQDKAKAEDRINTIKASISAADSAMMGGYKISKEVRNNILNT